jgi:hypothetical protein
MSTPKYEMLADQTVEHAGVTLYRIRALGDFGNVKAGDLGGFVQSERNLDQDGGDAWIAADSMAYGNSRIYGNAQVKSKSRISDDARVFDRAVVCCSQVYGETRIHGNAVVYGQWFGGKSRIDGFSRPA